MLPPGGDPQLLIRPAVEGTLNILRSAAKAGTVKRIVITGSIAAIIEPHELPYTYSSKDWNDHSVRSVHELGGNAPQWDKYLASKVLAERAAYRWVDDNKPSFDLSFILPCWVYGPVIAPVSSLNNVPDTPKLLVNIFASPEDARGYLAGNPNAYVHVRDVARAHVAAHVREDLGHNTRLILASKSEITFQQCYNAYWSLPNAERPKVPFEVPKERSENTATPGKDRVYMFDNAEGILGWEFASLAETVRDTLADLAPRIYDM